MARGGERGARGSAMVIVIVFVSLVAGLGTALLGFDLETGRSRRGVASEQRAFYAAEAAINEGHAALLGGALDPDPGENATLGDAGAPRVLGTSLHWGTVTRLDARRYSLVGSGRDGGSLVRHEVILSLAPNGLFQYAAFGKDGVRLDVDAFVDSYDSLHGSYASQVGAGDDFARQNAVVGSNGDVRLMDDTAVHGDCRPGPGGALYATAPGVLITGSTDPSLQPVELVPVTPPTAVSLGSASLASDLAVGPGIVRYDDLTVTGTTTLTIVGPAQLVVENFHLEAGTVLAFDTSGGPIELFAARDFVLASESSVTTDNHSAAAVKLFLAGDNRTTDPTAHASLAFAARADFVGAIHAPNAEVSLGSDFEVHGSVMAGLLHIASQGRVHFDEALRYDDRSVAREFVTVLWRKLGQD